jgi:hypothetical protein
MRRDAPIRAVTSGTCGLLLAALLAGCGGAGGSARADIERTLTGYLSAVVRGDGALACSQLTTPARHWVARTGKAPTCAAAISNAAGTSSASDRAFELRRIRALRPIIRVDGDRATAAVRGYASEAHFQYVDGRWRLTGNV